MRAALAVDRDHVIAVLLDALDVRGRGELDASAFLHALEEREMHVCAMAHGIWIAEAAAERIAQRHVHDLGLVERIHHEDAFGVHRARAGALADAERIECGKCVGAELDAGADLPDLRGLLEDLYCESSSPKRERGGKAADSATRDEDRVNGSL
jgi:hypothetical protein